MCTVCVSLSLCRSPPEPRCNCIGDERIYRIPYTIMNCDTDFRFEFSPLIHSGRVPMPFSHISALCYPCGGAQCGEVHMISQSNGRLSAQLLHVSGLGWRKCFVLTKMNELQIDAISRAMDKKIHFPNCTTITCMKIMGRFDAE